MANIFGSYLTEARLSARISKEDVNFIRNHPFLKEMNQALKPFGYRLNILFNLPFSQKTQSGKFVRPNITIEAINQQFGKPNLPSISQDTDAIPSDGWDGKKLVFYMSTNWMGPLMTEKEADDYIKLIEQGKKCVAMLNRYDFSNVPMLED